MIQILEGVPGSGKTYYAVNYALKNYSEYDTFSRIYTLKENHIIITNIEGLKINHLSLEKVISDKQVEGFFSQENLKLLRTKYQKVLFIIDEAQAFFTKEVWSKIQFVLQYHRHLGIDFIIITQDVSLLPKGLVALAEYIIRAKQRSLRLSFLFVLDFYDPSKKVKLFTQTIKPQIEVFRQYKSFQFLEGVKHQNVIRRNLIFAGCGVVVLILSIAWFAISFKHKIHSSDDHVARNGSPVLHSLAHSSKLSTSVHSPAPSSTPIQETQTQIFKVRGYLSSGGSTTYLLENGMMVKDNDGEQICRLIEPFLIECKKINKSFMEVSHVSQSRDDSSETKLQ